MAHYYYFRKSGKYYTDAKGPDLPNSGRMVDRDQIMQICHGKMPGLQTRGSEFHVVIVEDETSFPRMLLPELLS